MKKGKTGYLWLIVIIFILLWIPYFQNIGSQTGTIAFFSSERSFVGLYPWLLFLGVLEGALIVLYVKSVIDDLKKQEPQKFSL